MARKIINLGSGESTADGESIRSALGKCNDNFAELYADDSTVDGRLDTLEALTHLELTDFSVTTAAASGAGSLTYDNTTGVFTFTPVATVAETNDLSASVTWTNIPDAYVPQSAVTQHQAALTITQSQISDLAHTTFDQDLNTTDAVQFTDLTLDATLTFDNGSVSWVTNVTDDTLVSGSGNNAILLMEPNGSTYNAIAPNNTRIDLGVDPSIDTSGALQWGNIYLDTTSAITFGDSTVQSTAWTGSVTESQISDLQSYLTTVSEAAVTAHEAALTITESQISDLGSYITGYTVTESDVTAHQAALTITESQISDLSHTSTGNFTLSNNSITTTNAASNITIAINGATAGDPPAFVSKQWSFDTDGSFNFHNPLDLPSLQASVTATKVGQWDDAYGWGDHSTAGYLTSVTDQWTETGSDIYYNSGNVSIGTSTVSYPLTVAGSTDVLTRFDGSAKAATGTVEIDILGPQSNGDIQMGIGGSSVNDASNNISNKGFVASGVDLDGLNLRADNGYVQITVGGITSSDEVARFTSSGATITGTLNSHTIPGGTGTLALTSDIPTNAVESDTAGITGADQVTNIVTLTQAEYDAIGTPNASTVYIIVG